MQVLKYLILIIFALNLYHCKTVNIIKEPETIIELEKMSCGGPCHVFTFSIKENGQVVYMGKENVKMIGSYKSKLDDQQLDEIIEKFDKADFLSFEDSYKSNMMDLQTKYISFRKNGEVKRIKAYDSYPKKLNYLIAELDKLIDSLKWEKI